MFAAYLALGDSMTIDLYPYLDAGRERPVGRQDIGAAALLHHNDVHLWPDFINRDLQHMWPGIHFANYAEDGATTHDMLTPAHNRALAGYADTPVIVTLTIGGNDLLNALNTTSRQRGVVLEKLVKEIQARYKQILQAMNSQLAYAVILPTTVYDPTDDTGVMPGAAESFGKLPIEHLHTFNDFVRTIASDFDNTILADVHAHFRGHGARAQNGELWYWPPGPIEPSARGASEIRRVWLDSLVAARQTRPELFRIRRLG